MAVKRWTGSVDTDVNNPGNWDDGVPRPCYSITNNPVQHFWVDLSVLERYGFKRPEGAYTVQAFEEFLQSLIGLEPGTREIFVNALSRPESMNLLILSDWLEQRGDPSAELLRCRLEIDRLRKEN